MEAEQVGAEPADLLTPLQSPFPWFGGKSRCAHLVWPRFSDVPNYVEPFAGSLAVLLARPHAPGVKTVNDLDGFVCNFWRAVQADPEAVAQWSRGYDGEHVMPDSWECVPWKAHGGMANIGNGAGKANRHRERMWFSPHCRKAERRLFT